MLKRNPLSVAFVALALVCAVPVAHEAFAQAAQGGAPAARQEGRREARPLPPSRIEGRLAFLKTELKITDAQSTQWNALADAMRQNDKARRDRIEQMRANRGKETNTLERLDARERAAEARTQEVKRFNAAFRPLYEKLSDDQKKTADELFARHHGRRMHGRH
jgi:hypothetical protein